MFIFRPKTFDEAPPAAAIMPVDFFEVKRGKPRGNYVTMGIFTLTILLASLSAFVYLAISGSEKTTTVSEIKSADLTGIDGWEKCSMISKENSEYAPSSDSTFMLVNVMESRTECAVSLAAASPCTHNSNEMFFNPGYFYFSNYAPSGLFAVV